MEHTFDPGNNFVMFQQFASTRRRSARFDSLDKPRVQLQHPVDCFDGELSSVPARARSDILKLGLLFRRPRYAPANAASTPLM